MWRQWIYPAWVIGIFAFWGGWWIHIIAVDVPTNDMWRDITTHVSRDFISSIPDNQTMILTTTNTTGTFETRLFWNQVETFKSQGWNITNIRLTDDSIDRTEVTLVR